MVIRQANTHRSAGVGRGIAKMGGTGKLSNKLDRADHPGVRDQARRAVRCVRNFAPRFQVWV